MNEYWTLRQEFYEESLRRMVGSRGVPISQATEEEIRRAQGISLLGLSSAQEYFADDEYIKRQGDKGVSLAMQKISSHLNFQASPDDINLMAEVFHHVMKNSPAVWHTEFEEEDWDLLHQHISFRLIVPHALKDTFREETLSDVVDDLLVDDSLPQAFSLQNETGNLMMKKLYAVMGSFWDNSALSDSAWHKNGLGTSLLYPFLPQEEELFRVKDLQSQDGSVSKVEYGANRCFYQANMSNDLGYFEPPVSVFCHTKIPTLAQTPEDTQLWGNYNFTATLLMYVQIPPSGQKLLIGKGNLAYGFDRNRHSSLWVAQDKELYVPHKTEFETLVKSPPKVLLSGGANILPNVAGRGFEAVLGKKMGEIAHACKIPLLQPHPQTVVAQDDMGREHKRIQMEAAQWMMPPQKGLQIYDLPYDYQNREPNGDIYPLHVKLLGRDILTSSRQGIYDFREIYGKDYLEISTDAYRYLIENGLIERRQKELGFFDNIKRKMGSVPEEVVSDVSDRELAFLATFHPHFNRHLQFMLQRGVPANFLAENRDVLMKRYLQVLDWNRNGYWTVSNQVARALKQIPLTKREPIPEDYPLGNLIDKRNDKEWNENIEKFIRNMEWEVNAVCKMGRFANDTYRLGDTLERMGIGNGQWVGSSRSEKYYGYTYDLPLVAMMQTMWQAMPNFVLEPDMGTYSNFPDELKRFLPKEPSKEIPVNTPIKPVLKA